MNLLRNQNMQSMPNQQRGALLLVGLVMVLLMTIVGMAAIRGTGLQESMAGNMRDRTIAFQAAESALRDGEAIIAPTNRVLPPPDCIKMCPDQNATPAQSVSFWTNVKWEASAVKSSYDVKDIASAPRYVIEEIFVPSATLAAAENSAIDIGSIPTTGAPSPYRISARGVGMSADADAVLQTIFTRRFQ